MNKKINKNGLLLFIIEQTACYCWLHD